jgi:acetyltransferase EpsM
MKILIAGCGGLGKEILSDLIHSGIYSDIFFFDDKNKFNHSPPLLYDQFPILQSLIEIKPRAGEDVPFVCAVGHGRYRKKLREKIQMVGSLTKVVSHRSIISPFSSVGDGSLIQPYCGISNDVVIGECVLINVASQIAHDVTIGDYSTIGPNSVVLGHCKIGSFSTIHASSTILPGITIGDYAVVDAGSIVDRDVLPFETFSSRHRQH